MYPKKKESSTPKELKSPPKVEGVRLNKFISNAGICNRRQADALIKNGLVSINGKVVTQMGIRVLWRDKVFYEGRRVYPGEKVYVLINKPKGFVGTNKPVEGKRTLGDIVKNACDGDLYVVDYMGTNALGLLLLTNDGHFAETFGQGDNPVQQLYKVHLDKELSKADMDKVLKGIEVDKKLVEVSSIAYADETKTVIGLELKSPIKNVVTKLFAEIGYSASSIDRVIFAGLTKKNLARGQWRFLKEREVIKLKHSI